MSSIVILVWLAWMSLLDIKNKRVPMWLLVGGGILAIVVMLTGDVAEMAGDARWRYMGMLLEGMIPGIGLLMMAYATKSVGTGDGMVLALLGTIVGLKKSLLVLCAALFLAAMSSVVLLALKKVNRGSCLPFIPFLLAGWILVGIV